MQGKEGRKEGGKEGCHEYVQGERVCAENEEWRMLQ